MIEGIEITTLTERPHLAQKVAALDGGWPEFMLHDQVGQGFHMDAAEYYTDYTVVATAAGRPDEVIGRAYSVPIGLAEEPPAGLPDTGWDAAITLARIARFAGYGGDALCGLEVTIRPDMRSSGLGAEMLRRFRVIARSKGLRHFVAPVRPPGKTDVPEMTMDEYAARLTAEGLPADPLLRAQARLGASVVGIAQASMVVAGSLSQWREWTGLPFDQDGPVIVPGAMVPVHCDLTHDTAAYVEPNVWVHQPLS
ncbi:GNAT superfamily N-acetyltransferase [Saccharothrix ecbatanensis]|uniref:GNAT superfamily N-acetyltransferase n=1 Tax=Saccharothrix ecbatanensis TaxID=1105145 RepID=A0A7W9HJ09_9PSEU|nr:N-acetyltransferase [Saccharothrix ecbatanensis]MBB5802966.1 GNAT superfamily N-acetyltransferase [Saccharothrix ecbatanensis]